MIRFSSLVPRQVSFLAIFLVTSLSFSGSLTAAPLKVAFTGDQGAGEGARAVLSLIASEGADLLLIQGDLGYSDGKATTWEENVTQALGANFPVLSLVGNHENFEWPLYQRLIQQRIDRVDGLSCSGNTGVKALCRYKNIEVVQVSPGIDEVEGVNGQDNYADFITSSFAESTAPWRICAWHKNQSQMQTGQKSDATGWGVYDACLDAGAMIAIAHEHAYSRSYSLSDFKNQTIVNKDSEMILEPGKSFAVVSGLGGREVRPQVQGGDWWASIYTASQGATHGALFCTFEDVTANCYFKAIDGAVPDQFTLRTKVGSATESVATEPDVVAEVPVDEPAINEPDVVEPIASEVIEPDSTEVAELVNPEELTDFVETEEVEESSSVFEVEAEFEADVNLVAETGSETDANLAAEVEPDTDTSSVAEPGADINQVEAEPEADVNQVAEAEPEADISLVVEAESEADLNPAVAAEQEADTNLVVETELETELHLVEEVEPDVETGALPVVEPYLVSDEVAETGPLTVVTNPVVADNTVSLPVGSDSDVSTAKDVSGGSAGGNVTTGSISLFLLLTMIARFGMRELFRIRKARESIF